MVCVVAGDGVGDSDLVWMGEWARWNKDNKAVLVVVAHPRKDHRGYSGDNRLRRRTTGDDTSELLCAKKCDN